MPPWWVNGQFWAERDIVVAEALRLMRHDEGWVEEPADIWFHRDIAGPHQLGTICWCQPHCVSSADRRAPAVIAAELERAERRH